MLILWIAIKNIVPRADKIRALDFFVHYTTFLFGCKYIFFKKSPFFSKNSRAKAKIPLPQSKGICLFMMDMTLNKLVVVHLIKSVLRFIERVLYLFESVLGSVLNLVKLVGYRVGNVGQTFF